MANNKEQLSYEDWRKMGPEEATEYLAGIMQLDKERKRKLLIILKHEWQNDKKKNTAKCKV